MFSGFVFYHLASYCGRNYFLYPFCECVLFLLCLNAACKSRVADLGGCGVTQAEFLFENSIKRKKGV